MSTQRNEVKSICYNWKGTLVSLVRWDLQDLVAYSTLSENSISRFCWAGETLSLKLSWQRSGRWWNQEVKIDNQQPSAITLSLYIPLTRTTMFRCRPATYDHASMSMPTAPLSSNTSTTPPDPAGLSQWCSYCLEGQGVHMLCFLVSYLFDADFISSPLKFLYWSF